MPNSKQKLKMTSKPPVDNCHWENPRICATCKWFKERPKCTFSPPMLCRLYVLPKDPQQAACANYSPKQTD